MSAHSADGESSEPSMLKTIVLPRSSEDIVNVRHKAALRSTTETVWHKSKISRTASK